MTDDSHANHTACTTLASDDLSVGQVVTITQSASVGSPLVGVTPRYQALHGELIEIVGLSYPLAVVKVLTGQFTDSVVEIEFNACTVARPSESYVAAKLAAQARRSKVHRQKRCTCAECTKAMNPIQRFLLWLARI